MSTLERTTQRHRRLRTLGDEPVKSGDSGSAVSRAGTRPGRFEELVQLGQKPVARARHCPRDCQGSGQDRGGTIRRSGDGLHGALPFLPQLRRTLSLRISGAAHAIRRPAGTGAFNPNRKAFTPSRSGEPRVRQSLASWTVVHSSRLTREFKPRCVAVSA